MTYERYLFANSVQESDCVDTKEFDRLVAEKLNNMPITPDLAEKVSLLPITTQEARGIRAQISTLQQNVARAHDIANQAQVTASAASDTAEIAKTAAEATREFSSRILKLEFTLNRIVDALNLAGIKVDLDAK